MPQSTAVFVGICGSVLALDRSSGRELWLTELKGSDFVNVVLDDGDLLATTRGEVFCLDPETGQLRWHNELKGLGRGLVTIASRDSGIAVVQEKRRRDQAAEAAAAGAAGAAG